MDLWNAVAEALGNAQVKYKNFKIFNLLFCYFLDQLLFRSIINILRLVFGAV